MTSPKTYDICVEPMIYIEEVIQLHLFFEGKVTGNG